MIVIQDASVVAYLEKNLKVKFSAPYYAIGFATNEGRVLAGFLFNDFNGSNIEMSIAIEPGGLHRPILKAVAEYVFDGLKCRRLSAKIKRSNKRALKAAYRFGFRYEGISKHYFPDSDAVRFFMLREHCRWISHEQSVAS